MSYCLAIKVNDGLVFASDSRSNAGVDYITTYSKMFRFCWPGERSIVLLNAGSLATTQAVINMVNKDMEENREINLKNVKNLYDAAQYIGKLSQEEQLQHSEAFARSGVSGEASFILGGQIADKKPELYMIYPQGNYISASPQTPFLQIGENKYGKPILDRLISLDINLEDASRCALISLDSTIRSNLSVGLPLELAIYKTDSIDEPRHLKFDNSSVFYRDIQKKWGEGLKRAFKYLPRFEWEKNSGNSFGL